VIHIRVDRFRQLRDIEMELENITIVEGWSCAGKTNLIEAIAIMSSALHRSVDDNALRWRGVRPGLAAPLKGSIRYQSVSNLTYHVTLGHDGRGHFFFATELLSSSNPDIRVWRKPTMNIPSDVSYVAMAARYGKIWRQQKYYLEIMSGFRVINDGASGLRAARPTNYPDITPIIGREPLEHTIRYVLEECERSKSAKDFLQYVLEWNVIRDVRLSDDALPKVQLTLHNDVTFEFLESSLGYHAQKSLFGTFAAIRMGENGFYAIDDFTHYFQAQPKYLVGLHDYACEARQHVVVPSLSRYPLDILQGKQGVRGYKLVKHIDGTVGIKEIV
jgi:hypothetical protein